MQSAHPTITTICMMLAPDLLSLGYSISFSVSDQIVSSQITPLSQSYLYYIALLTLLNRSTYFQNIYRVYNQYRRSCSRKCVSHYRTLLGAGNCRQSR